jgi:hypothetical protein
MLSPDISFIEIARSEASHGRTLGIQRPPGIGE